MMKRNKRTVYPQICEILQTDKVKRKAVQKALGLERWGISRLALGKRGFNDLAEIMKTAEICEIPLKELVNA
jgi:hypothetical protein